jgi:hypothetical protein
MSPTSRCCAPFLGLLLALPFTQSLLAAGPVIEIPVRLPPLPVQDWQRPLPLEARSERSPLADAEPVDPAEFRVQTLPPPRPVQRAGDNWLALGPAPTRNAQVSVPPNNEVAGGVHRLAAHPSNADILYVGAVNGGIWRTSNATAASPTWVPLSDGLPSQSIGAIAFDPLDGSRNTLIAGTGRWSNFAQRGDDEIGVYYSSNGGNDWSVLGGFTLVGQKITAVAARGATLMAAARGGGLYRSINTGANWTLISGTGNLPIGGIGDMVADPGNSARFYISVLSNPRQVLRSDNTGASWTDVTAGLTGLSSSTGNIRLAVGPGAAVFAAVVNNGVLAGVFRSADSGASWTPMDVPAVHPGAQGTTNTSLVADPTDANIVYLGGDRITASPFTGNVQRGNASAAAGAQFTPIVNAGAASNSAPHADSRDMVFDAAGNLLECSDGGVYRRTNPRSSAGVWQSLNGNLSVLEVHDLDHDRVADVLTIGTQDNGTHMQPTPGSSIWTAIFGGDGGDIAVNDVSLGNGGSYRFMSSQNLGGFTRRQYNAANAQVGSTSMPAITGVQFVTPVETNPAAPNRLLVGGSSLLFESLNADTPTPTLTSIGGPGANRNAMTYGSNANADAAYVGSGAQVYRRDPGGFVATTALPAGANTITDVSMDPDNPDLVFAVDDDQVFRSSDAGASWQDVNFNLPSISARDFRTIEYIPRAGGDIVAVGSRSGVFVLPATGNSWSMLGNALPDVLVFDLRYQPSNQTLYAGTLGRGVWSYGFATDTLFANGFE